MAEMERTIRGAQFKGKDSRVASDRFDYQKNANTNTKIVVNNTKSAEIGNEPTSYIPLVTPNGIKYIPVYSQKYGSSGSRGPYSNITTPAGRPCNLCYSNCNKNYSNYNDCASLCDTTCNMCNTCQGCQGCNECYTSCNPGCNTCQGCYSCLTCEGCNSCNTCQTCEGCDSCNSCQSCNTCQGCYGCNSCNVCQQCHETCYGSGNCRSSNCGTCVSDKEEE